eukprot:CAMPEP_0179359536 /NCGR_PEP_ID=MMETSP0797-20121207/79496_1 /TAXON_ID=47934 /ORGANISM="Dinophysis acuminata, Strain DAEP01" /LENGTH=182 /DNA_ID=CAMNT_0021074831 /DNA_START=1 /DNA_END=546 /DNA_ORIENTATION=-
MRHNAMEDAEGESHSKENSFEANFISALSAHLIKSGYDEYLVAVLGQVRLLKQKMRRDVTTTNIQVTAVDNFQGEENDIIIISLVRSNRNKSIGFLGVDNRINVALTRARHGMFIIGNADMLRSHSLWGKIIEELRKDDSISDQLPLIEPTSGGVFKVRNCDEISLLLDDPTHRSDPSSGLP